MTLKELCTKNKTSLAQISRETGITTVYLSQLNTGVKKNPSLDIMSKISNALKVKMEEVEKSIRN